MLNRSREKRKNPWNGQEWSELSDRMGLQLWMGRRSEEASSSRRQTREKTDERTKVMIQKPIDVDGKGER